MTLTGLSNILTTPQDSSEYARLRQHALVCLSHLRWDLVFQRPQHLITRSARRMPVYFVEEPAFEGTEPPYMAQHRIGPNLTVLVPHVPAGFTLADAASAQKRLLTEYLRDAGVGTPVLWFYTPAALAFADALPAAITVYDRMDELSAFAGASPELCRLEAELLRRADLVFTGGMSLYEAKRGLHDNVHAFPSAVDVAHFAQARRDLADPLDQAGIGRPRLGFFGVIDERLDRELLSAVARLRPDWQLILVGPVVKIDPSTLPEVANIHYLGRKTYEELPAYVAGWDAAIMPFARNEATRFISPTKTPEYLAAGKPVISTPIVDVVRGWGHLDAVRIAEDPVRFVTEAEIALSLPADRPGWLAAVDRDLEQVSWDRTWERMAGLIETALGDGEVAVPPCPAPRASDVSSQYVTGEAHV